MTDAVEKGFGSIVFSLDGALMVATTRRAGRVSRWGPLRTATQGTLACAPLAARDSERERLEVLDGGGEMELVAHRKAPLAAYARSPGGSSDALTSSRRASLVSRSCECLCLHLSPSDITGVSVEVAGILLAWAFVKHFALIGHTSQSRFEAR